VNSQAVSKIPSRSRESVSVLSFFALLFNSANAVPCWLAQWQFREMVSGFANVTTNPAKMIIFLVSIICLGGLFASPAEAVVKTYYAQQDGTCGSNYGSGLVWQSAAEGGSNCGSRSRIGSRDATGDFLIAVTPSYASETTITGQTGSNIYFNESGRGGFTGRVRFVEVNAAGDTILGNLTGEATVNVPDSGNATITNLSGLSGTINAGNRLGMVVAVSANGVEPNFYFGESGGGSSREAWFVVDEVSANNALPNVPTNLAQYKSDGSTVITAGGTTDSGQSELRLAGANSRQ